MAHFRAFWGGCRKKIEKRIEGNYTIKQSVYTKQKTNLGEVKIKKTICVSLHFQDF